MPPTLTNPDDLHSVYGGSVADKWLSCPGYWAAVKDLPQQPPNEYTVPGSAQHALIETVAKTGKSPREFLDKPWLGRVPKGFGGTYDEDSIDRAMVWFTYVAGIGIEFDIEVEKKVMVSSISREIFGSADLVAYDIPGKRLIVADYKDGGGKIVDVETTPQLRLYAVGVDDELGLQIDRRWTVTYAIIQPRAPRPVTTIDVEGRDVIEWRGIFRRAWDESKRPDAPLVTGSHCTWCRNVLCPALMRSRSLSIRKEFSAPIPAAKLTPEQIAHILRVAPEVDAWIDEIQKHALAQALAGKPPPGFKVVEGRLGNRKWGDPPAAEEALVALLADGAYVKKALSPAQAEKALGDGFSKIARFVIQDAGKPALAVIGSEHDNYSKQAQARAEFVA